MVTENTQPSGVGLPPGTRIGRYEILERIGIGGQAIVYRCRDTQLGRDVALKQISPHLAEDPKFLQRFRREAQILARLGADQEAVLAVYEIIEHERGLFIVTEYVAGETLEHMLQRTPGPVELKTALRILWRLASALNDVHRAGIVHRDLKPSNVLVGEGSRLKIADFGVAASVSGQTSMILGTTKYMAPELFEGGSVDGRSDMYSLGFIAYEMLVGRPKFLELFSDVVSDPHSEALRWMKWHGNAQATVPPLWQVNPQVPRELSDVVAKMMAKNVADRYENMETLGRALKDCVTAAAMALEESKKPRRYSLSESALFSGTKTGGAVRKILESPATAPLPKKKLSRRARIFLLSLLGAMVVAAGVFAFVEYYRGEVSAARGVRSAYAAAVGEYDRGEFAASSAAFEGILARYPGKPQAEQASVMAHLARANQAVKENNWKLAALEQSAAEQQLKNVQASRPELADWARKCDEDIRKFAEDSLNARSFTEAMEQAREALREKRYSYARATLEAQLRRVPLSAEQARSRDAMLSEIERLRIHDEAARKFAQMDDLIRAGKFEEARQTVADAQEVLDSPAAKVLPAADLAYLRAELARRRDGIENGRDYSKAMVEAIQAHAAGDFARELDALNAANALRPSKELSDRIADARAGVHLRLSREAMGKGDLNEARRELDIALKEPVTPAMKAEIDAFEKSLIRRKFVTEGDADLAAGRFQDALNRFTQAQELSPGDDIGEKIVEARFRAQLAEGDKLRDERKYDMAQSAYEKARDIKPSAAAEVVAAEESNRRRQQYDEYLARADIEAAGKQWEKARTLLLKAKEVLETPEVNSRLAAVKYQQNLSLGDDAVGRGDYRGAIAYFKIAQTATDTEEIRKRIADAEDRLKQ
jgi:serine/threonine protein kinase/tetratricopeptide (TPR) repeat protein